jgi:serine/threonine-protein kinase RsbW
LTAAAAVRTDGSELLSQPPNRLFVVTFTPDETRVARMRRITAAHLRHWNVTGELAKDVVVAVSELVTNAVRYGHGDITFKVLYAADELWIEVTDGNPTPARLSPAGEDDESGRGLLMVAHLAWNWGVSDHGETTWCVFRVPAGRP